MQIFKAVMHSLVTQCFDFLEERTVPIFRGTKLVLSSRWKQFCDPEDRGIMFGIFNVYTLQKFQIKSPSEKFYNTRI